MKYSETSIGAVVILPLHRPVTTFSGVKQTIHDQTRQIGYQTVPFSVYIHSLVFLFDIVFCKKDRCGCDFTTCHDRPVRTNIFRAETSIT